MGAAAACSVCAGVRRAARSVVTSRAVDPGPGAVDVAEVAEHQLRLLAGVRERTLGPKVRADAALGVLEGAVQEQ